METLSHTPQSKTIVRFFGLAFFLAISLSFSLALNAYETAERSWKTLDELSPAELAQVDLSTDTPRHPEHPYLPAEPFPFT